MTEPLTDAELAKIRCWEPDKGFSRYGNYDLLPAKERRLREEYLRDSIPGLLATIDSERERANRAGAEVEKLRECAECTETCNYTERHAYALATAEAAVTSLRAALRAARTPFIILAGWDMLTLVHQVPVNPHDPYKGWRGAATGDAPWARRLIDDAVEAIDAALTEPEEL